jgi:hypothetical protein
MIKKNNITVFANFFIDSNERFLRLKDSFNSFVNEDIDFWVINTRGSYKLKVNSFLKKNIAENKIKIFDLDSASWFNDSKNMIKTINTKLIFFWIEDHICLNGPAHFKKIIKEILLKDIDYLQYSFFLFGLQLKSLKNVRLKSTKNLFYFNYTKSILKKRLKWFEKNDHPNLLDYIISQASIMKFDLFKKIISSNEFTFFSKKIPFSFEKNTKQTQWLPYKIAIPKKEFFAAIDSNQHTKGYSLISRGFYKKRKTQKEMNIIREKNTGSIYNFYGQIYFSKPVESIKKFIKKIIKGNRKFNKYFY